MKKIISVVLLIFFCLTFFRQNTFAEINSVQEGNTIILYVGSPTVFVNEIPKQIDPQNEKVVPSVIKGKTLIPASFLSENLGAEVTWNPPSTIEIKRDDISAVFHINDDKVLLNGQEVIIDTPPALINGRAFLPLKFLGETVFSLNVQYDRGLIILSESSDTADKIPKDYYIAKMTPDKGKATELMAKYILSQIIKPEMTDLEKEYAIFRYLSDNVFYDGWYNSNPQPDNGNAYGPLVNGIGICGGIAHAANYLLKEAGFESVYILGYDIQSQMPHAWNIVKIGEKYYHMDATNNRFQMNDDQTQKDALSWDKTIYPVCDGKPTNLPGHNLFVKGDWVYYFDTSDGSSFSKDFYKCNIDGSEKIKITTLTLVSLLDGSGESMYFAARKTGSSIFKAGLDGSEPEIVTAAGTEDEFLESFAVRNGFIYFRTRTFDDNINRIYRTDLEGNNRQVLLEFTGDMDDVLYGSDWISYRVLVGKELQYYKMKCDGTKSYMVLSGANF